MMKHSQSFIEWLSSPGEEVLKNQDFSKGEARPKASSGT